MLCCTESPWVLQFLVRLILKYLCFGTMSNVLILKYFFFGTISNMTGVSSVNNLDSSFSLLFRTCKMHVERGKKTFGHTIYLFVLSQAFQMDFFPLTNSTMG